MPRHHSPDQKADALTRLQTNGGDIITTSFQTGIPQRTLYTWRQELWLQQVKRQRSLPAPSLNIPHLEFDNDTDAFMHLRSQVIEALNIVSNAIRDRLPTHGNTPWMYDRLRAQNGLIDCLLKLNALLKPHLDELRAEAASHTNFSESGWDEEEPDEEYAY
jgi:hypothetical protein